MLNVIQMIAEGFNESKALRTLVHERFNKTESTLESLSNIMSGRFQNFESQLDMLIKRGVAENPTQLLSLQSQLNRLSTDHGLQISKLNTQLTSHLAERTKLKEQCIDHKVRLDVLDK